MGRPETALPSTSFWVNSLSLCLKSCQTRMEATWQARARMSPETTHLWSCSDSAQKVHILKFTRSCCPFFWQGRSGYRNTPPPRCPILIWTMSDSCQTRAINLRNKNVTIWLVLKWHRDGFSWQSSIICCEDQALCIWAEDRMADKT